MNRCFNEKLFKFYWRWAGAKLQIGICIHRWLHLLSRSSPPQHYKQYGWCFSHAFKSGSFELASKIADCCSRELQTNAVELMCFFCRITSKSISVTVMRVYNDFKKSFSFLGQSLGYFWSLSEDVMPELYIQKLFISVAVESQQQVLKTLE